MDLLWAPWRMKYIQKVDDKKDGCIFCSKPLEKEDRKNLILMRGENVFVMMNLYPYNNGHLMVIPYQHTNDILNLPEETSSELWKTLCLCKKILEKTIHPEGFNIGINLGRVGGAGIDQHVHLHIVPRWNGDTNFMPVVGKTKIISQGLEDSYDQLFPHFNENSVI